MKRFCIFIITIALVCISAVCAGCSDSQNMVTLDMWRFTSGVPNNLITVHSGDKNTSFILTVDEGEFWSYEEQIYTKRVRYSRLCGG